MKFLFEDDTFSFETLRTTGFANYFGADLGEVLATARQITDGDQGSWHRAWKATAARVAELGEQSLAAGHRITARENLLRASNYYRNAAAFVLDNPADRPRSRGAVRSPNRHLRRRERPVRPPSRSGVDSV